MSTPPGERQTLSEQGTESFIERRIFLADRGARPITRGWFHFAAALASVIFGTMLSTIAWIHLPSPEAAGVTVYCVGVFVLFAVSAAYHRGPWRSSNTVRWWRRADHATIAVFIAATYTPLCLIALPGRTGYLMLVVAWTGAIASVVMNLVWIEHPRWLAVVVYLALGWLIIPLIPQLWNNMSHLVVWLLLGGGFIYTIGAVVYGMKWPGRQARWYGYHEHFHTATIIAAAVHYIAIWIVVTTAS